MIPKIIHYCWFGPKPFPKLVEKCIETWNVHLSDYEFYFWNESNSPMDNPYVKEAFASKKYAFVADYVRFWALYHHGGIYLDTDMFFVKSLNGLLQNGSFFGWETAENKILSCGVIGCEKENAFIGLLLTEYDSVIFDLNNKDSIIVTRLISKCYDAHNDKNSITIYPYDYFYPFPYRDKENVRNFLMYSTENTIAIHLWNISWGSSWAKLRDRFFYTIRKIRQR